MDPLREHVTCVIAQAKVLLAEAELLALVLDSSTLMAATAERTSAGACGHDQLVISTSLDRPDDVFCRRCGTRIAPSDPGAAG
jgi:hypothetical protein